MTYVEASGAVRGTASLESPRSAVAWPAIFGGAFVAAAVGIVLVILGAGIGLASISPFGGASAAAFGVGAAIWLVITQWVSAAAGGYVAGRLRTKWSGVHTHEVFFRDTAHGFITWSLATVMVAAFAASSLTAIVGAGTHAATSVASGAAQGATSAIPQLLGPDAYFVDRLFRAAPSPATGGAATTPATATGTATGTEAGGANGARVEATRIFLQSIAAGQISGDDRTYLAQLITQQTGIPQADAEKRIDDTISQAQAAEAKVKTAADAARQAGAKASLYLAISLLIGAFIACVAAAIGGSERDEIDTRLVM